MAVLASDPVHTVVLLLPDKKEAYPLSTLAFTRAQGSPLKISTNYRNAFIVEQDRKMGERDVLILARPSQTPGGIQCRPFMPCQRA